MIRSPRELSAALRNLIALTGSESPNRLKVAQELRSLATQLGPQVKTGSAYRLNNEFNSFSSAVTKTIDFNQNKGWSTNSLDEINDLLDQISQLLKQYARESDRQEAAEYGSDDE